VPFRRHVRVEQIMGMPVSCHVRALPWVPAGTVETALDSVMGHLRLVDSLFSTWQEGSAVMRWRRGELDEADAHPWLAEVRALTERARELTDGLFDAWCTGDYDPTGLVKGWAVEGASAHLAELGGVSFALAAGGDLTVGAGRGVDPAASPWRVGVEDPRRRGSVVRRITLGSGAVATSGAAVRGGHVLDPRTRQPVLREGSATVVGRELTWVDVWATAAFVDPDGTARLLAERSPSSLLVLL
jgi:FAD:protein FMN transferase